MTDNTESKRPVVNAIVQARMGSTRLEGKALADLAGRPLLYHVLARTAAIRGLNKVILATGSGEANRPLMELAASMGLEAFAGSEDNVLERFCLASVRYPSDYIVRVTGDNPFTDTGFAEKTVEMALETGADLCSFTNLPLGTAVETLKTGTMLRTMEMADRPYHFEHVTPFIKEHPEMFTVIHREVNYDNPLGTVRLTVDTAEDLELAVKIYNALYKGRPFDIGTVLAFLKENPGLLDINRSVQQKPMTSSAKDSEDSTAQ